MTNISFFKKTVQMVSVLGPRETYSDMVSQVFFGSDIPRHFSRSICEVIQTVQSGEVSCGIVPLENFIHGTVRETFDGLFETPLPIIHVLRMPIAHVLAGVPGATLKDITKILSHTQPIGQCQKWIQKELPDAQLLSLSSTSEALHTIQKKQDCSMSAIGHVSLVKNLGLTILKEHIQDTVQNYTDFAILTKENISQKGNSTLLVFLFDADRPGALLSALQIFAEEGVNLNKIESRPHGDGNYRFYIEFTGTPASKKIQNMLQKLQAITLLLKVLGNFEREKL